MDRSECVLPRPSGWGTTIVVGRALAARIARLDGIESALAAALLAIALGTFLEGVAVGALQELALRRRLARLPWGAWTTATAIGAAVAWALGMVPSTVIALTSAAEPVSQPPTEPAAVTQLLLAAGLGIVTGPTLGFAQWTVLRRVVDRAGRWLWANAVAWSIGMPLIVLGMDSVPWGGHPLVVVCWIYALCGAAGVAVGAVHGRILVQLVDGGSTV
jgi:hypothetical protein